MSLGLPLNHCRGTLPLSASLRLACSFVTSIMYCLLNFLGRASVPRIRPGKEAIATASCSGWSRRRGQRQNERRPRHLEVGHTFQGEAPRRETRRPRYASMTYVCSKEIHFEKLLGRMRDRRRSLERPAEEFRSHVSCICRRAGIPALLDSRCGTMTSDCTSGHNARGKVSLWASGGNSQKIFRHILVRTLRHGAEKGHAGQGG